MFCDKCGAELKGKEKYCSNCGEKIEIENDTKVSVTNDESIFDILLNEITDEDKSLIEMTEREDEDDEEIEDEEFSIWEIDQKLLGEVDKKRIRYFRNFKVINWEIKIDEGYHRYITFGKIFGPEMEEEIGKVVENWEAPENESDAEKMFQRYILNYVNALDKISAVAVKKMERLGMTCNKDVVTSEVLNEYYDPQKYMLPVLQKYEILLREYLGDEEVRQLESMNGGIWLIGGRDVKSFVKSAVSAKIASTAYKGAKDIFLKIKNDRSYKKAVRRMISSDTSRDCMATGIVEYLKALQMYCAKELEYQELLVDISGDNVKICELDRECVHIENESDKNLIVLAVKAILRNPENINNYYDLHSRLNRVGASIESFREFFKYLGVEEMIIKCQRRGE